MLQLICSFHVEAAQEMTNWYNQTVKVTVYWDSETGTPHQNPLKYYIETISIARAVISHYNIISHVTVKSSKMI